MGSLKQYEALQEFWMPTRKIGELEHGEKVAWLQRKARRVAKGEILQAIPPVVLKSLLAKGWIVEINNG